MSDGDGDGRRSPCFVWPVHCTPPSLLRHHPGADQRASTANQQATTRHARGGWSPQPEASERSRTEPAQRGDHTQRQSSHMPPHWPPDAPRCGPTRYARSTSPCCSHEVAIVDHAPALRLKRSDDGQSTPSPADARTSPRRRAGGGSEPAFPRFGVRTLPGSASARRHMRPLQPQTDASSRTAKISQACSTRRSNVQDRAHTPSPRRHLRSAVAGLSILARPKYSGLRAR